MSQWCKFRQHIWIKYLIKNQFEFDQNWFNRLSLVSYPLFHWIPSAQNRCNVNKNESESDKQHLQIAVHCCVDSIIVTKTKSRWDRKSGLFSNGTKSQKLAYTVFNKYSNSSVSQKSKTSLDCFFLSFRPNPHDLTKKSEIWIKLNTLQSVALNPDKCCNLTKATIKLSK